MAEPAPTSDSPLARAGTAEYKVKITLTRSENYQPVSLSPPSGLRGLVEAEMESVLRRPPGWGPAVLQSPAVPAWCPVGCRSQASPPSPVLRNCCARPQGGQWATWRIWQPVNLSSRISGAAVWVLFTGQSPTTTGFQDTCSAHTQG